MEQEVTKEVDRDLTLHYIDKVHAALLETGKSVTSILLVELICSFVVIALSVGVVSADKEFSFGGIKFGITPWLLIFAGAWLCGALFIYWVSLFIYEAKLRGVIRDLYSSINYEHESMSSDSSRPYALPDIADIILGPFHKVSSPIGIGFGVLIVSSVGILIGIGPIIAIALATYRMYMLFGMLWWIVASFAILLFGTIGYLIIGIKN